MKNLAVRLVHHIGEHVQPPAMGHAEHDVLRAQLTAAFDDLFQRRDHGFAAIYAEALGADKFGCAEPFEGFRLDQLVENRLLAFRREGNAFVGALDPALQPILPLRIVDVHEFVADSAAIGPPQKLHDLARGRGFQPHDTVGEDGPFHVLRPKTVKRGLQLRMILAAFKPQGIEIGFEMADDAIGAHELNGADGILGRNVAVGVAHTPARGTPRERLACIAGKRADQLAVLEDRLGVAPPGRSASQLRRRKVALAERLEKGAPCAVDRTGIFEILRVEPFDEGSIGAEQKGGGVQKLVRGRPLGPV